MKSQNYSMEIWGFAQWIGAQFKLCNRLFSKCVPFITMCTVYILEKKVCVNNISALSCTLMVEKI